MRKKWKVKIKNKNNPKAIAILAMQILLLSVGPIYAGGMEEAAVCVQFGLIDPTYVIYEADDIAANSSNLGKAVEGTYVPNENGWVVQNDYSQAGRISDEEQLLAYLNTNRDQLMGTTMTLLRVENDGFIYEDGIDYLSILGDSISTLAGVTDMAGYNSATEGNAARYFDPQGTSNDTGATLRMERAATWWDQVIAETDFQLLVNSSVRGETVKRGTKRINELYSDKDVADEMHSRTAPDVIVVYLGTNDYRSPKISTSRFYKNYCKMLQKLCSRYERAQIYCIDLTDCYAPALSYAQFIDEESGITIENWSGISYRLQHFNEQIASAVNTVNANSGGGRIHLIKLSNQNYTMMQTLNISEDEDMSNAYTVNYGIGKTCLSVHPNAEGQALIADAVKTVLEGGQMPEKEDIAAWIQSDDLHTSFEKYGISDAVWEIKITNNVLSEDGTQIYLDQYDLSERQRITKIRISKAFAAQNLFTVSAENTQFNIRVLEAESLRELYSIELLRDELIAVFLKNFHKIEEYIEIPVDICAEKNEILLFCKRNAFEN